MKKNASFLFVSGSLLGIFFFLFPLSFQGKHCFFVTLLSDIIQKKSQGYLPKVLSMAFLLSWLAHCSKFFQERRKNEGSWLKKGEWIGIFIRFLAAYWAIGICFYPKILPPTWMAPGSEILTQILPTFAANLLVALFFLPFLLDFGLFECIAIFLSPIMRPLFDLPGEAAINALLSWVGDNSIGSLVAIDQYKAKRYTAKEALVIISSFSAASMPLCMSLASGLGLANYFAPFYATTALSSLVAALILPRIAPLANKPHGELPLPSHCPSPLPLHRRAFLAGKKKAASVSLKTFFSREKWNTLLDFWGTLFPFIMVIGSLGLWMSSHTPIFLWMGRPFGPLLRWMGVPDPEIMSEILFVGFVDMLLPILIVVKSASLHLRFLALCLSVSQILCLSDIGVLLLKSPLPIPFFDIVKLFLLRTLITFPLIFLMSQCFF